jgi:hypothetical protein
VVGGGGADDTGVDPACEPTVLEWAVQPATATAAAMVNAAMMRTGRMATSPLVRHGLGRPGLQPGGGRSRHGDGGASRQRRKGLDPVAIVNQIEHAG